MKTNFKELDKKIMVARAMLRLKEYCSAQTCDKCRSSVVSILGYNMGDNKIYDCTLRTPDMKQDGTLPCDFDISELDVKALEDKFDSLYFEEVKRLLFINGYDAISDFVGYDYPYEEEKSTIEARIEEAYQQMPRREFEMFCSIYGFDKKILGE